MYTICFEDVEELFRSPWLSAHENNWYKKAWSILEKEGLTKYDTEEECYNVYILVITLSMMYSEFCELAFEECHDYMWYDELFKDVLPTIVIGQLYAKYTKYEITEDANDALCRLAEGKRTAVYNAISNELDETTIFLGMYYTAAYPYNELDETCDIYDYDNYWYIINEYRYWLESDIPYEAQEAFAWLCEGTYDLGL